MAADLDAVPDFLHAATRAARAAGLTADSASIEESADRWLDLLSSQENRYRSAGSLDTTTVRGAHWQLNNLAAASALKLAELALHAEADSRLRECESLFRKLAKRTKHLCARPVSTTPEARAGQMTRALAKARRTPRYPKDALDALAQATAAARKSARSGQYRRRWVIRNRDWELPGQRLTVTPEMISWRRARVRMHAKDHYLTVEVFAERIGLDASTVRAIVREADARKKSNQATRNRLLRALGLTVADWYAPRPSAK